MSYGLEIFLLYISIPQWAFAGEINSTDFIF